MNDATLSPPRRRAVVDDVEEVEEEDMSNDSLVLLTAPPMPIIVASSPEKSNSTVEATLSPSKASPDKTARKRRPSAPPLITPQRPLQPPSTDSLVESMDASEHSQLPPPSTAKAIGHLQPPSREADSSPSSPNVSVWLQKEKKTPSPLRRSPTIRRSRKLIDSDDDEDDNIADKMDVQPAKAPPPPPPPQQQQQPPPAIEETEDDKEEEEEDVPLKRPKRPATKTAPVSFVAKDRRTLQRTSKDIVPEPVTADPVKRCVECNTTSTAWWHRHEDQRLFCKGEVLFSFLFIYFIVCCHCSLPCPHYGVTTSCWRPALFVVVDR